MRQHAVSPCRAAEDGHRASVAARGGERGGERADRRHQPGAGDQQPQPAGDLTTVGRQNRRQGRRRHRQADEVVALEVEFGRAHHAQLIGQLDTRQIAIVDPVWAIASTCSLVRQPSSTSNPARASSVASAVPHAPAPITAIRRIGASPPSHSHWSITHGQIRSVTAPASAGDGCSTTGNRSARPGPDPDLVRTDPHALADRLGADHGDRHDRRAGLQREPADPAAGRAERARTGPRALREDQDDVSAREDRLGGDDRLGVRRAALDRERAERGQQPRAQAADRRSPAWRRSTSGAAPCRRSRTDRGSCGGWRR